MSFSAQVKNDLARIMPDNEEQRLSELSAIIRLSGRLKLMGIGRLGVSISTENPAIARKTFSLIKSCFGIHVEIHTVKNTNLKKSSYILNIENNQGANEILEKVGIIEIVGGNPHLLSSIPDLIFKKEANKRAFIRGAFLASGSISDPSKNYHFEIVAVDEELSEYIRDMINSYNLKSKIIERKSAKVIYIKESESISDILNLMGAHTQLLHLENVKISKQVRNDVNRLVNCETANINKTVDAAKRQVKSIEKIRDTIGISSLPENLQEIALLRLENYDISLKELGEMMSEPLGKSGVNHRLKRIQQIAEELGG
ncbi:MAG: DNA-binding protein WhiA [Filifactoraceae bacterium]